MHINKTRKKKGKSKNKIPLGVNTYDLLVTYQTCFSVTTVFQEYQYKSPNLRGYSKLSIHKQHQVMTTFL